MATPNYGYEKRQRELAKKQKKADKMRERAQRKADGTPHDDAAALDVDGETDGRAAPADTPAGPAAG